MSQLADQRQRSRERLRKMIEIIDLVINVLIAGLELWVVVFRPPSSDDVYIIIQLLTFYEIFIQMYQTFVTSPAKRWIRIN